MNWDSMTSSRGQSMIFGVLMDQNKALGRIEGKLDEHGGRLDRIEDKMERHGIKLTDFLTYLPGVIVLGLALLGKMSWQDAASHLSGFGH